MAEITWVNHASFVVQEGSTALICDPWLDGSVFNNGWNLLSQTRWQYEDFRRLTHIYFSHEHPDHFFPPNIQKIPQDARSGIEVIFQATKDHKVIEYCKKLGFKTRELQPFEWTDLGNSMRVMCGPFPPYDSWLLIDAGGKKILNLNDCQVKDAAIAKALLNKTGPLDVLLSQFSYACWVGNPEDIEWRRGSAKSALRQISYQLDVMKPRFYIPSASFILFSHEENNYLNDSINRVDAVLEFARQYPGIESFAMYPGDTWTVGSKPDGSEALRRYTEDYDRGVLDLHKSQTVPRADLEQVAEKHLAKVRSKNNWTFVRLAALPPARLFGTVKIFISDYDQVFRFDIFDGLREAPDLNRTGADISMSSASLAFVLKNDFGWDTLYVNACFRASRAGFSQFERSMALSLLNNTGRTLGPSLLFDPAFCYTAARHFFPKIRSIFRWRLARS
jgi:UDP-MurNAc hydroxylase